jgi:hypothetical protein
MNKNRTYKMLASRGSEIIFDDRIQADSPRDARERMKKLLGLTSLSGIVYSVTEIPVDLIREIVDARVAELLKGAAHEPVAEPAIAPEEPDWSLVRRHFRRYGDPAKTADKYGVPLAELEARAEKERWAA